MSWIAVAALVAMLPAPAAIYQDTLREAKALFFDRDYASSRDAWNRIREAQGPESDVALYWIGRCSESLDQPRRALREYGEFLEQKPRDGALAEEALTRRIALAAHLFEEGETERLQIVRRGLSDSSPRVRYFAAFEMAALGPEVGRDAVPVLKEILRDEEDPDIVDRAQLALLRVDRAALEESSGGSRRARAGRPRWIKIRIFASGASEPEVSLNLPLALAELLFDSLPDAARAALRDRGYDSDSFWEQLKSRGRTEIIDIEGDDGEKIRIWVE